MRTTPPGGEPANAEPSASTEDLRLVESLRDGDEAAFVALVECYHTAMLRLAQHYVANRTAAEDVVQETWLGVINGIGRFEGRSSLKTWIFRILTNRAKSRGERERGQIPLSDLFPPEEDGEPAVDPARFHESGPYPGHWAAPPRSWGDSPEGDLLSLETRSQIQRAIEGLPPGQRDVITLRDVEGWTAGEVCAVLQITDANQRVLLHRARSKVRAALEADFDRRRSTARTR